MLLTVLLEDAMLMFRGRAEGGNNYIHTQLFSTSEKTYCTVYTYVTSRSHWDAETIYA